MKPLAIGIDIGGTHTRIGGVTVQGDIMVESQIATHAYPDGAAYLQALHQQVRQLMNKSRGFFEIVGIGIGAPGMRLSTGSIEDAANLPWEKPLPILNYFEECLDLPIQVTNDANLTAIGELLYGVGRSMSNFLTITLGTGLGGGIIANGELLHGDEGQAGEFGHMIYQRDGRQCGCGRRGCLETYVSAPGLQRTVMELMAEHPHPTSRLSAIAYNQLTARMVHEAALEGDLLACEAIQRTGTVLGQALADLAAAYNPEAFIIAGGLAKAGNMLYEPVRRALQKNLLHNIQNDVQVLPGSLEENDMALLGASALVWKHLSFDLDDLPERSLPPKAEQAPRSKTTDSKTSIPEVLISQNQILP